MKSPYERVGAKGIWTSISDWWYCSDCNVMRHLPEYQISRELKDYLHKDAAKKFPTIAKIRNTFNAPYVDLEELNQAIANPPILSHLNMKKGFLDIYPGYFASKHPLFLPRSGWICSQCNMYQMTGHEFHNRDWEEDEVKEHAPLHCNQPMKLGVISYFHMEVKYELIRTELIEALDHGKIDAAAWLFLQYIISEFADLFIKRVIRDTIFFWKTYPQLTKTFEFELIQYFLSIFAKYNYQDHRFNKISLAEVNTVNLNYINNELKSNQSALDVITSRYDDWKEIVIDHIKTQHNEYLLKYLGYLWAIDGIVHHLGDPGHFPDMTGIKRPNTNMRKFVDGFAKN
jgi:hypothetical protein